ncbi:MAG TPA: hypothetical protein VMT46_11565 [Anaerolineaceae bacterium]|nr:hypothetical protein [Anaerolineaceae bacterium]
MNKIKLMWIVTAAVLLLITPLTTSCTAQPAQASGLRVTGAYDMTTVADAVQKEFQQQTGIEFTVRPSTTSVQDLQSGRADVAILGREPKPDEIKGMQDTIVGYDAVCMLISTRTYNGGLQQNDNRASGGLISPVAKFAGIKNLTMEQLRNIEANLLQINHDDTYWFLTNPAFYTFQAYNQTGTGKFEVDPANPQLLMGMWVWNSVDFRGENLLPGKFDTQAVLMEKLGFAETLLNNNRLSFATRFFDTEEELISARYVIRTNDQMDAKVSSYSFDFFVRQASRRVTLRAIKYNFLVKAFHIDGIDPLGDPSLIYSGRYPLSRKIHVLTRQPATSDAGKFVTFLLSPAGQKLIANAEFLPLPLSH